MDQCLGDGEAAFHAGLCVGVAPEFVCPLGQLDGPRHRADFLYQHGLVCSRDIKEKLCAVDWSSTTTLQGPDTGIGK
jgi:hypothetical protein